MGGSGGLLAGIPAQDHRPAAVLPSSAPEAIVEINRLFEDRDVPAEQAIYFEGDPGEHLYLVAMGKVKLLRHTTWDAMSFWIFCGAAEYFGSLAILGGRGYTETAVAQTDCCILQISASNFEKILNHYPDVSLKVLQAVGQRLEESQEIVKQLSVYSADQRIAAALIRLAKKMGEQKETGDADPASLLPPGSGRDDRHDCGDGQPCDEPLF